MAPDAIANPLVTGLPPDLIRLNSQPRRQG